jgi:hypothetical protein
MASRGLAFTTNDIVVSTKSLEVVGTAETTFSYYSVDSANQQSNTTMTMFNSGGSAMIQPVLSPGWNHVCVFLNTDGGTAGTLEAERCIDIAYLTDLP